ECSYCTDAACASPSHYTQYTLTVIDIYCRAEMSNEECNALTVDVEVLLVCDDSNWDNVKVAQRQNAVLLPHGCGIVELARPTSTTGIIYVHHAHHCEALDGTEHAPDIFDDGERN
ncbi:unnamed protein product, partial [Hydatigera taeniaeformis]|uniref:ZP domain-containing protein n=1 Tax=Hydatigena taeniaeformis TaxID=6205 RepID=A0A0R3WW47_HYDTA